MVVQYDRHATVHITVIPMIDHGTLECVAVVFTVVHVLCSRVADFLGMFR